jgi:NAD(P)H dehydrogenase (quinone)
MSKVIVLYDSRSGFTEKLAETVVQGIDQVANVEAELLKIGTPFFLAKFDEADAIIFGSPNWYDNITPEFRHFLDALKEMKNHINLSGKIAGIFASYGWHGGFTIKKFKEYINFFDMKLIEPSVLVARRRWLADLTEPITIDEEDLQKCRKLGETIAQQVSR